MASRRVGREVTLGLCIADFISTVSDAAGNLSSLFHDESCEKLAALLLAILHSFDNALIESMPQRYPWLRAFRDEAFPADAAIRAVERDIGLSLLILRSYIALIAFRVFMRKTHFMLTPRSQRNSWDSICYDTIQCLRTRPAESIRTCLAVLLEESPFQPDNTTQRLNDEMMTAARCIELVTHRFTRNATADPFTNLDLLETHFSESPRSDPGESVSMIIGLLAPHRQVVASLGRVRSRVDPRLLQLTLQEAESRAQYQRAQQQVARTEQQLRVLQGQLHILQGQLQSIRLPGVCMRFRYRLEMLAPRYRGESQTDAWRRTWHQDFDDAIRSKAGVLWQLISTNCRTERDVRQLRNRGHAFYGTLSQPIHSFAPADLTWSEIDDKMWSPDQVLILKYLERK